MRLWLQMCRFHTHFHNITQAYNHFNLVFYTGGYGFSTSTITLPPDFYTSTSLNYYLQQSMTSNGYIWLLVKVKMYIILQCNITHINMEINY
jgi:hypothetical protein